MRRFRAFLLAGGLIGGTALPLSAQRSGVVGTVTDTAGAVLAGVQVELSGTDFGAMTNSRGEFRLTKVKPGEYTIHMRRVGFSPVSSKLVVPDGNPIELDIQLAPSFVKLAPVNVKAYMSDRLKNVGFQERQRTSGVAPSRFITRSEIEQKNPLSLVHMIDRLGGRVRNCIDGIVYIDGVAPGAQTDFGVQGNAGSGVGRVGGALRGSSPRTDASVAMRFRLLDNIPPRTVEGMELYATPAEIPTEFRRGQFGENNNRCVVLIWTRTQ